MNCIEIRNKLPLHLYGDLAPAEHVEVESHLAECAACRAEVAGLGAVRRGFDQTLLPTVAVDLAGIYRRESARQLRRARLWQAAALVGVAVALLVLVSRIEIRANNRQIVVHWGEQEPAAAIPQIVIGQERIAPPAVSEARFQDLRDLVHLLAENVRDGDRDRTEQLAKLRRELTAMQQENQQNQRRLSDIRREIGALYTAQFGSRHSGEGQ